MSEFFSHPLAWIFGGCYALSVLLAFLLERYGGEA